MIRAVLNRLLSIGFRPADRVRYSITEAGRLLTDKPPDPPR